MDTEIINMLNSGNHFADDLQPTNINMNNIWYEEQPALSLFMQELKVTILQERHNC